MVVFFLGFVAHPIFDDVVALDDGLHLVEPYFVAEPDQLLLDLLEVVDFDLEEVGGSDGLGLLQ